MFYDGDKAYSPLICVGRNITPAGADGPHSTIPCLCISPSGRIAVVEPDPFRNGESSSEFISRISDYIGELRKWDHDDLDCVAADYFYDTTGQAARGVDIMARNGYVTWAAEQSFFDAVDSGLKTAPILVMVSVDQDELPMRRVEFSSGEIAASGLLFSIVPNEVGQNFLSPKT